MLRLQKWLSMAGTASRRKAEEIIAAGRVTVNGAVVTELGAKADPLNDVVEVDGKVIEIQTDKVYIMLHKPEGVVTTVTDPFGRSTVMDFVPADVRLFPVGRLDSDTSGLLLLTNDGEWAQKLSHPKYETKKTYVAVVKGVPASESLRKLRQGITIEGKKTAPAQIKLIEKLSIKNAKLQNAKLLITIHEGRNRQVRNMCEAIGHKVINLKRIAIGSLELGSLPKGKWRHLTAKEVKNISSV
jgi:pseudouridine synthase